MEIEEVDSGNTDAQSDGPNFKEHRVPIDHESFYDGRVFGELKSRATVHMEVRKIQYSRVDEKPHTSYLGVF